MPAITKDGMIQWPPKTSSPSSTSNTIPSSSSNTTGSKSKNKKNDEQQDEGEKQKGGKKSNTKSVVRLTRAQIARQEAVKAKAAIDDKRLQGDLAFPLSDQAFLAKREEKKSNVDSSSRGGTTSRTRMGKRGDENDGDNGAGTKKKKTSPSPPSRKAVVEVKTTSPTTTKVGSQLCSLILMSAALDATDGTTANDPLLPPLVTQHEEAGSFGQGTAMTSRSTTAAARSNKSGGGYGRTVSNGTTSTTDRLRWLTKAPRTRSPQTAGLRAEPPKVSKHHNSDRRPSTTNASSEHNDVTGGLRRSSSSVSSSRKGDDSSVRKPNNAGGSSIKSATTSPSTSNINNTFIFFPHDHQAPLSLEDQKQQQQPGEWDGHPLDGATNKNTITSATVVVVNVNHTKTLLDPTSGKQHHQHSSLPVDVSPQAVHEQQWFKQYCERSGVDGLNGLSKNEISSILASMKQQAHISPTAPSGDPMSSDSHSPRRMKQQHKDGKRRQARLLEQHQRIANVTCYEVVVDPDEPSAMTMQEEGREKEVSSSQKMMIVDGHSAAVSGGLDGTHPQTSPYYESIGLPSLVEDEEDSLLSSPHHHAALRD